MNSVIIFGAGEHGAVVADVIQRENKHEILGFVDDSQELVHQEVLGLPILGNSRTLFEKYRKTAIILAIGNNQIRRKLARHLENEGFRFISTIHPDASVSCHARLDHGVVVMPRAVVNTRATIGAHAILNSGCIVEHDCVIGISSHISVGAILAGRVFVGDETLIGAGAVVLPHITVGAQSVIGAGAVVTQHMGDSVVAVGIPARINPKSVADHEQNNNLFSNK